MKLLVILGTRISLGKTLEFRKKILEFRIKWEMIYTEKEYIFAKTTFFCF